jgi:hypothetical protein
VSPGAQGGNRSAPDQVRKFPHVLNIQHVHAGVKAHVRRMRIQPISRLMIYPFQSLNTQNVQTRTVLEQSLPIINSRI